MTGERRGALRIDGTQIMNDLKKSFLLMVKDLS